MELSTLLLYFKRQIDQIAVPKKATVALPNMPAAANQDIFDERQNDTRLYYFEYLKDNSSRVGSVWFSELKDFAPKVKKSDWFADHSKMPYLVLH